MPRVRRQHRRAMYSLVCTSCQTRSAPSEVLWRCRCGGLLELEFTAELDRAQLARRKPTMWRYREVIPLAGDEHRVSFDEGFTPLLAVDIGGRRVLVKQDQLFPSSSYKDRGASVLISHAAALGVTEVIEDSSGNAGAAIAAYCARAGLRSRIYVPADTSAAKLAQIRAYGAELVLVPGSREATAAAAWSAAETTYYASHVWNPFFLHGTKTFAYEVWEQLDGRAPDAVVLPAGNGTLLLGAYLGFGELARAGLAQRVPRLIGVQSAACAPLQAAFTQGSPAPVAVEPGHTSAEGIAIAKPVRGAQMLAAVRATGGCFLAVGEPEIHDALLQMQRRGFYIEPTAAATIAGVRQFATAAAPGDVIVSAFTGNGLKATPAVGA